MRPTAKSYSLGQGWRRQRPSLTPRRRRDPRRGLLPSTTSLPGTALRAPTAMATSLSVRVTPNAHPRSAWSPARPRLPLSHRTPAFADRDAQARRVEAVHSSSSPLCVLHSSALSARESSRLATPQVAPTRVGSSLRTFVPLAACSLLRIPPEFGAYLRWTTIPSRRKRPPLCVISEASRDKVKGRTALRD